MKTFERDPTFRSIDKNLLSRYSGLVGGMAKTGRRFNGMAPTGRCRRVVPIPRNSIENSLWKIVKTFERDATDGSIDTNLLSRHYGRFHGMAPTGRCRGDSTLLYRKKTYGNS